MHTIRGLRDFEELSQTDLGQLAKIPARDISLMERERLIPTPGEKRRIARVLNVSAKEIFWPTGSLSTSFEDIDDDDEEFDDDDEFDEIDEMDDDDY